MALVCIIRKYRLHRQMLKLSRCCSTPCISVIPNDALIDQQLKIKINGLASQQPVTLHSSVIESGATFAAYGCYIANSNGEVDIETDTCLSGTYTGVDSMGLFWSMIQAPGQHTALRILKKDVNLPVIFKLSLYDGHQDWDSLFNSESALNVITTTEIRRWYKAKDVTRHPVKTGSIRGSVFIPPGPGPFPGVIDIFGGAGGLVDFRAALLASKGFAVLALAYFAYDDLQPNLIAEFSLDYFNEAVDWLLSQSYVKGPKVAVNSVCKGAEMGMALSTYCPKVKALVAINGVPFVLNNPMKHGKEFIPCPVNGGYILEKVHFSKEGMIMKFSFDAGPEDMFKLWKADTKVLCIVGEDDQCVSPNLSRTLYSLYPEDKKSKIELVVYPGAGHLIEPPYAPLCRASYMSSFGVVLVWGGEVKKHAYAQKDSWDRIIKFLKENMSDEEDCDRSQINIQCRL